MNEDSTHLGFGIVRYKQHEVVDCCIEHFGIDIRCNRFVRRFHKLEIDSFCHNGVHSLGKIPVSILQNFCQFLMLSDKVGYLILFLCLRNWWISQILMKILLLVTRGTVLPKKKLSTKNKRKKRCRNEIVRLTCTLTTPEVCNTKIPVVTLAVLKEAPIAVSLSIRATDWILAVSFASALTL